jgi:hypothetical protein
VVYSSWPPVGFFRPWAVSFVIPRSVSQIDSLEWSKLGNSTSSEIGMMFLQFRCPGTKNKKIAPFAKQTSLDHVLKNKKKEEFGPMTCRELYLKFQYLIRLEDKGAPFGIQLVSHSLCMDLVTVGQAPCIIHFLFFFYFFNKYSHYLSSGSRIYTCI